MSDISKEVIYAKVLARDMQEAAERNLQRNDKLIEILFDPDADLSEKYKAFYKIADNEGLKKISDAVIEKLNLIYFNYMTLKKHADRIQKQKKKKEKNKEKTVEEVKFENKMLILKSQFNNLLLRMLKVAKPTIAKTLWGIRGLAEQEARKKIALPFEEE